MKFFGPKYEEFMNFSDWAKLLCYSCMFLKWQVILLYILGFYKNSVSEKWTVIIFTFSLPYMGEKTRNSCQNDISPYSKLCLASSKFILEHSGYSTQNFKTGTDCHIDDVAAVYNAVWWYCTHNKVRYLSK